LRAGGQQEKRDLASGRAHAGARLHMWIADTNLVDAGGS